MSTRILLLAVAIDMVAMFIEGMVARGFLDAGRVGAYWTVALVAGVLTTAALFLLWEWDRLIRAQHSQQPRQHDGE